MVISPEGFLYPEIDDNKCTLCMRCLRACPVISKYCFKFNRLKTPKTYACWIKNSDIRMKSSSGGFFSVMAINVLKKGGMVFGAAFDNQMHLRHISINDINKIDQLRRSKYLQSEVGNSFKQVKGFLLSGKTVFFVGTPCQVAGLNSYLRHDFKNLITADFICHGVPSPGIFLKYIKYLEGTYGSKIIDINFRDKRKGWGNSLFSIALFENQREIILTGRMNGFRYGFSKDLFLRESCYKCNFKSMPRVGDFTMADFWGIQYKYPTDAHKGISCILVNSTKANKCLDNVKSDLFLSEELFAEVKKGNRCLYSSPTMPINRRHLLDDFLRLPFDILVDKYLTPPLLVRIRSYIKVLLSLRIILVLQRTKTCYSNFLQRAKND